MQFSSSFWNWRSTNITSLSFNCPLLLFTDLYLLLIKSPCNLHCQKQPNSLSQWGLSNACKNFFVTMILLQWKTEVKRLGSLKAWRGNRFRCNIFRLCKWCKKSDHLVLRSYFYLQSWHLVQRAFFCDFLVYFCIWKISRALFFWVIVVLCHIQKHLVEIHVRKMIAIYISS